MLCCRMQLDVQSGGEELFERVLFIASKSYWSSDIVRGIEALEG